MSPDEQEARSRRLSNDRIILLPLSSGAIAVFNNAGELCGIIEEAFANRWHFRDLMEMWHPPAQREAKPRPTLEELGL